MSFHMQNWLKCISIAAAFTVGSVSCFSAPSTARVINQSVLTVQMGQKQESPLIQSNLLTEEGQTLLLSDDFSQHTMEFAFTRQEREISETAAEPITGTLTAVSSDETRLQIQLDTEQIRFEKPGEEVKASLTLISLGLPEEAPVKEEEQIPEQEPSEEAGTENEPEAGETPGTETEPETGETPGTETESEAGGETGTETESEAGGETGTETEPETGGETGTKTEPEAGEETGTETEPETGEETGAETEPETGEETGAAASVETPTVEAKEILFTLKTAPSDSADANQSGEDESTETDIENSTEKRAEDKAQEEMEPLKVELTFICGEQTLLATILLESIDSVAAADIDQEAAIEKTTGEETDASLSEKAAETSALAFCPTQFDPNVPMCLIGSEEQECIVGTFPAMTRYKIEEEPFILLNAGNILIPAGERIQIDLSMADIQKDLCLTAGESNVYEVKLMEVPKLLQDQEGPVIVNAVGLKLGIPFQWGTLVPTIKISQLTVSEGEMIWKEHTQVCMEADEEGNLWIDPANSEAGTYRANIFWMEQENVLYELEIPFFVQYTGIAQGGSEE